MFLSLEGKCSHGRYNMQTCVSVWVFNGRNIKFLRLIVVALVLTEAIDIKSYKDGQ